MLTQILNLFTKPIGRTVIMGAILAALLVILMSMLNKKDPPREVNPYTITKRIEYMEDLRLVTMYFEEIISIGPPDKRLDKENRWLEGKNEELIQDTAAINLRLEQVNNRISELEKSKASLNANLNGRRLAAEELQQRKRFFFPGVKRIFKSKIEYWIEELTVNPDIGGDQEITDKFKAFQLAQNRYWNLQQAVKAMKRKDRKKMKDQVNAEQDKTEKAKNELEATIQKVKDLHGDGIRDDIKVENDQIAELERRIKRIRRQEKDFRAERTDLERQRDDDVTAIQNNLDQIELNKKAIKAEKNNTDRLLIVVPASITGYIDMSSVKTDISSVDSLVRIKLPEPRYDSVVVRLDTAQSFAIGGSGLNFRKYPEGRYFTVFKYMRQEVNQLKKQIEARSRDTLMKQTVMMGKAFFEDFYKGFGYSVVFSEENPLLDTGNMKDLNLNDAREQVALADSSAGTKPDDEPVPTGGNP
ncbi:MAG: DUF4230 domain-containing protein [Bacteroidota bacterium]